MEYRERPEIDIEPKEFADLKKELKKVEGELCLPLITKGIDDYSSFKITLRFMIIMPSFP